MIHIVGAPFDLCGRRVGSRLGPTAIRLEGLAASLGKFGRKVEDVGSVVQLDTSTSHTLEDKHARANEVYKALRARVAAFGAAGVRKAGSGRMSSFFAVRGAADARAAGSRTVIRRMHANARRAKALLVAARSGPTPNE